MRIESCHITGYGKFKNKKINFNDGLNVLKEDNGWGKTTLCSFIKAMFYGNPSSRAAGLNDRKQYNPWDKGTYGGSLTFTVDDKKYRIERIFGAREKEDVFALYDADTNLVSMDYSDKIGEEIFGIDRDSFAKSIYIPQNAIKPEMTSTINGKLGDLVTVQDDINNFDEAIKRIDDEIKIYTRNGKEETRGLNLKIKDEINILREDADRLDSYVESKKMQERMLRNKEKERRNLVKEKESLKDRISKQSENDQLIGEYKSVLKSYEEEKNNLDKMDDFFANGIPTEEEIREHFELAKDVDVLQNSSDNIQKNMPNEEELEQLKKLFDEPLDDAIIDDWMDRANRLAELRVQKEHAQLSDEDKDALAELKYYFAKKKPTKEELEIIRNEAENVNRLQGRIEETREYYEQQKHLYEEGMRDTGSSNKPMLIMLCIIGGIVLVGSVATFLLVNSTLGLIMGIAGVAISLVLFGVSLSSLRKKKQVSKSLIGELEKNYNEAKNKYEQTKSEYETSDKICRDFLSDYLVNANDTLQQMVSDIELKAERYDTLLVNEEKAVEVGGNALEELTSLEVALYTELMHYQVCYGLEDLYSSNAEIELIQRIKEDNKIYIAYFNDDKERSSIIEKREAKMKKVAAFLNRFPLASGENISQKIGFVATQRHQYIELSEKVSEQEKTLKNLEKNNLEYNESMSIEELQDRERDIDESIRTLDEEINQTRVQLRDVRDSIDACQESSNQIDELKEKLGEYEKKVNYLKQTASYLTKAKERFLSTYMRPLQKGMREYLEKVDEKNAEISSEAFHIDTKLGVSVNYEGNSKEEGYLSAGYRDLASLCARFALIDIMYEGQKPPIILDDPFTNFDEDKIDMALGLIEELSKEKQILYFTCHKSRAKK